MELIGSATGASIDFTSIPQDGTDLVLYVSNNNIAGFTVRVNNISTTENYNYRQFSANGTSLTTTGFTSATDSTRIGGFSSYPKAKLTFFKYAGINKKIFLLEDPSQSNFTPNLSFQAIHGVSVNTGAITSLQVLGDSSTKAELYKITAGSGGSTVTTA